MRITIVGAGAIGTYLAARLGAAGADPLLVARGSVSRAIEASGVRVDGEAPVPVRTCGIDRAASADVAISCVKAHAIPALAADMTRLVAAGGIWLTAVNGLPWCYGDTPLASVDPGGGIRHRFPIERAAVCVAYLRCETSAPGVVRFSGGKGLFLGMADGRASGLLGELARVLAAAGVPASLTGDLDSAIWNKLFGNVGLNPMTALNGLTVDRLLADAQLRATLVEVTAEAMRVAASAGAIIDGDAEARVAFMQQLGTFRTSMLQDVDAGRPLELDAILGALVEVGRRRGIATPASCRLYETVRAFAASRGLLPA